MIDTSALPIKVEYVGRTKREDWECFEWRVTFAKQWSPAYYTGLGHVEKHKYREPKPAKPTNDDILHSLILDASAAEENFSDWCANYGYSDDSMKAFSTYKACLETATHLRKYLGREMVAALAVQLQDH
jgi:hypothetical protein